MNERIRKPGPIVRVRPEAACVRDTGAGVAGAGREVLCSLRDARLSGTAGPAPAASSSRKSSSNG